MNKHKWEISPMYGLLDRSSVAAHLETMAAKGWMLEKIGTFFWKYRRIEPKALRFSVTFFSAVTPLSPEPTDAMETYRDYCAAAGWQLAAALGAVQIFFHEDSEPVPIETDPAAEYDNICQFMKKSCLAGYWTIGALSLYQILFQLWRIWTRPVETLSNGYSAIAALIWLPMALLSAAELVVYYRWKKRAKAAAESDCPLPEMRSARKLSILSLVWSGLVLLLLLFSAFQYSRGMQLLLLGMLAYMALMGLLLSSALDALRHLRTPRWVNLAVTCALTIALMVGGMAGLLALVLRNSGSGWLEERPPAETYEYHGRIWEVYDDPIPLRIEDLADTDYDRWSTEAQISVSPLLAHGVFSQRPRLGESKDLPDLDYELVILKAPFLYDLCKQDYIQWLERDNDKVPPDYRDEYRSIDPAPWGAQEVYQAFYAGEAGNRFLICWQDRIAEVDFPWKWTVTAETAAAVSAALKGAAL